MSFAFAEDAVNQAASGTAASAPPIVNAILGYLVVFIGLTMLMIVIIIVGKIFTAKKAAPAAETAAPAAAAAPEAPKKLAPGSAGDVKIYDTDPRDAAMIMAIVADKLGKPLNELRFRSIKEVK
jgi:Na+-transporting methylmalonyl-CoA/oxaloacetate decarboxylase gamma subunit